jgi:hypothetical protein
LTTSGSRTCSWTPPTSRAGCGAETHDEWAVAERRYLSEESMAKLNEPATTIEETTLAITA